MLFALLDVYPALFALQSDSGLIGLIMSVVGSLTGMVVGW